MLNYLKKVKIQTCYNGRRLSSLLQIKDNTRKEHEHDIVYHVNCPEESCEDNYIGESGRRLVEGVKDHGGTDNKLHISKRSIVKMDTEFELIDFKRISRNYNNNKCKEK